ncbi:MAG: sulfatase [Planctomycetota bacterium]|nr:sulfatase [Planctomycetota bacterium]
MKRRDFLRFAACVGVSRITSMAPARQKSDARHPNILFITVDDMSCDSVGVFGCKVKDTTPNLDRFAGEGVRFTYAHVQAANCVPSRNVMQTGRYPHTSGVEGFYKVRTDFPILPDLMSVNGYFTAIKGKVSHSTPYQPYPWDMVMDQAQENRHGKGNTQIFYNFTRDAIAASDEARKPFYMLVNIIDPHKPFYALGRTSEVVPDKNKPSRVFAEDDVVVPGFLPDFPITRKELAHYYSSVRRADDCVAATLKALSNSGRADNTVVMFLSDHGMPFPFAKTNVYHHSTRTPWIVRWPGRVKPGSVDSRHMISAIDFMPTVLDIAGIDQPPGLQGRSFLPLLLGKTQEGRDYVVKEYNENSGGGRHPMRAVETKKYCYIFNPWANGQRRFRTATQGMQTYKQMVQLAPTDPAIASRLRLFDYRTFEEFYDCENDPDARRNLIDDPRYTREIDRLRKILEQWMVTTSDHCLEAFRNRHDPEAMEEYIRNLELESQQRRAKARKAKGANQQTRTNARRSGAKLISLSTPRFVRRGQTVTVTVNHKIPADLGEQLIHVTLKEQAGKRIDRKVVKCRGTAALKMSFAVPANPNLGKVVLAAFIGKDYPHNLQHIVSKPLSVR